MLRTNKSIVGSLLATAMSVLLGDLALAGKPVKPTPEPPPLPHVRYRIKYVGLPNNAEPDVVPLQPGGMTSAFSTDEGNSWHVRVVGRFRVDGLQFAFLYDPTVNANEVIDLNSWFDSSNGVPPGCKLSGAWDINEHQVVVGSLRIEFGTYVGGYAIDLAADTPVVDLLPTPAWTTISSSIARGPMKINENGDILIRSQDASGTWGSFLYNPGLYNGDPDVRAARDGIPLDFSGAVVPESQFIQGDSFLFQLSNPVIDPDSLEVVRPAQVAGVTADGLAFRYTSGTYPVYEDFGFQVTGIGALNDDGAFCGVLQVPLNKNRCTSQPFRYDDIAGIERLGAESSTRYFHDMNNDRDLFTERSELYRDDWGGWVALDGLLVGTDDDKVRWTEDPQSFLYVPFLSDRILVANSSEQAGIIAGGGNNIPVILTPEAAP